MSRLGKFTPRGLARSRAERQEAEREAARAARELAEIRALQDHVAQQLNRPFLAAVTAWTESGAWPDLPPEARWPRRKTTPPAARCSAPCTTAPAG